MNEENTKKDLALGTGNDQQIEVVGDRIIVQLDEAKGHTVTAAGVVIPLNDIVEKDSGKLGTATSDKKHLAKGTVLGIGELAYNKLKEAFVTLSIGDRVFVNPRSHNKDFYFFLNRDVLVQDFEGVICIPHTLIEAKIKNNELN